MPSTRARWSNGFVGALPEHEVQAFVDSLGPVSRKPRCSNRCSTPATKRACARSLEIEPGNEAAVVALAQLLVDAGRPDEALALLDRIPENDAVRHVAAAARLSTRPTDDYEAQLDTLLDQVKADDEARQQYVDILELMGPLDPRTAAYRKKLTARLF